MTEHQSQYLLIYTALVAAAMLIEAIALGVLAFVVVKLVKQLGELTRDAQTRMYPVLTTVHELAKQGQGIATKTDAILSDVQPKLERISTNLADTSDVYRAKVAEVDELLTDATTKARRQSDRVDGMVTTALTRTGEIASHLHNVVTAPARQLSGLVNGAKATLESLIHNFAPTQKPKTPKPVAFEGESVYTGLEDDYHA